MRYRSDIDGLRAIAVLAVIAFHSGIELFAGGFIGVDVFFVISGYLITSLIYEQMAQQRFSFLDFYKRRAARLLPALAITFLLVTVLGFFFYDAYIYDQLGKDLFFSALGVVNIYFAQGTDYFASAAHQRPLIHLWSLGVEEQFYVVWPVLLLALVKWRRSWILPAVALLFVVSLASSEWAAQQQTKGAYFLPHYRAFELLLGAFVAILAHHQRLPQITTTIQRPLAWIAVLFIVIPMLVLDAQSAFPGFNALWPCLGTAWLIAYRSGGLTDKFLAARPMVLVGLISYPLYLFHQPILVLLQQWVASSTGVLLFAMVTVLGSALAWLTYRFVEQPIRRGAHQNFTFKFGARLGLLIATLPAFAAVGIWLGRTDGMPSRFDYLNPFATEVVSAHQRPHSNYFANGFQVAEGETGKLLVVGDSLAQQYALPLMNVLGYQPEQVDSVTRGACVLLKGTDFRDQISDISCDDLREQLYRTNKTYDVVLITQAWHFYKESVVNFDATDDEYRQWRSLLSATVEHFAERAEHVLVVAAHPMVNGYQTLQPSILLTPERYQQRLENLAVENQPDLQASRTFFNELEQLEKVTVLSPEAIFCQLECELHDGQWSYFSDSIHITQAAIPRVEAYLRRQLKTLLANDTQAQEQ
ncbi:acyltransferase family protein [Pseudidiomarina salilacus]|uniref:acyltransferase family protein n=1 Tax=Pseudidiomarina salilacus TaxID=3384452 RepID=UPI0039847B32